MSYVSEVEECLRRCFPDKGILGPEEYTAIADWEKSGIAVEVVKMSIEEFRADAPPFFSPESILEIEGKVKQNFRRYLQLASTARS